MSKAVIFGAGNIGRGFIGQLFYKSGFSVTFVDVNPDLVISLNRLGEYPLKIVSNSSEQDEIVRNITAVDGKYKEAVVSSLQSADIIATAVGIANLDRIAGMLADGIHKRIMNNLPPVNILVCENMIGANKKLQQAVKTHLPGELHERLDQGIGFVEVSVGRMVPSAEPTMKDPLLLQVEPYEQLPYDVSCWRGAPVQLHGGVACDNFDYYIKRKLFVHNLGHAVAGYFGFLKGCRYIHEAMGNPALAALSRAAMEESGRALNLEFPDCCALTAQHIDDLSSRFCNRALADPVARVCLDPLRKLGPEDRLVGAMRNCHNLQVGCPHILSAIAAALLYEDDQDQSSIKMRMQIDNLRLENFLSRHCGIKPEEIEIYYPIKTAYISLHTVQGGVQNGIS